MVNSGGNPNQPTDIEAVVWWGPPADRARLRPGLPRLRGRHKSLASYEPDSAFRGERTASLRGHTAPVPLHIDLDDLRTRARARAYRSLTPEERFAHLLPEH
jgi:hypothetical protein